MTHSYAAYSYFRALINQKNSTATPAAKHMSRIEVRKLASIGFLPLEAMALKFTLMPSAAMAMPSTMYANPRAAG